MNHDTKLHCKIGIQQKTYFTVLSSWMNQVPGRLLFFSIYEIIVLAKENETKMHKCIGENVRGKISL